MVKGLGTVVYPVADLSRAKAWYSTAFQQPPYFDQPFYVGFNISGYELRIRTLRGQGAGWRTGGLPTSIVLSNTSSRPARRLPRRFRTSAMESKSRRWAIHSATRLA